MPNPVKNWSRNAYERMAVRWASLVAAQRYFAKGVPGPFRVVEIGVAQGYTSNTLVSDLLEREVPYEYFGIDNLSSEKTKEMFLRFKAMHLIEGNSVDVSDRIPGPIHFLFIDGDHSYQSAKADLLAYKGKVADGFIIVLHDVATTGARQVMEEMKHSPEWRLLLHSHEPIKSENDWTPGIAIFEKVGLK